VSRRCSSASNRHRGPVWDSVATGGRPMPTG
jgi:hypothetical protein